jgi:cyclase
MQDFTTKRIIPSIYTSDGQFALTESSHILSYTEALQLAIKYEEEGADELVIMDVTTITERRRNLPRFLKDLSKSINIPFVFGGGVHTIRDVEDMLKTGVQRIYVNSAAVRNPELINKITKTYGSNSLLVAIDTRLTFGHWKIYLNGGKSRTEIDLMNWIEMCQMRGAGELLVSTVARGYTEHSIINNVLKGITSISKVPVLASVGVQKKEDFAELFTETGIAGIVSAHFFLKEEETVKDLKSFLRGEHIFTQGETTSSSETEIDDTEETD